MLRYLEIEQVSRGLGMRWVGVVINCQQSAQSFGAMEMF